jgi:hypothetical protein
VSVPPRVTFVDACTRPPSQVLVDISWAFSKEHIAHLLSKLRHLRASDFTLDTIELTKKLASTSHHGPTIGRSGMVSAVCPLPPPPPLFLHCSVVLHILHTPHCAAGVGGWQRLAPLSVFVHVPARPQDVFWSIIVGGGPHYVVPEPAPPAPSPATEAAATAAATAPGGDSSAEPPKSEGAHGDSGEAGAAASAVGGTADGPADGPAEGAAAGAATAAAPAALDTADVAAPAAAGRSLVSPARVVLAGEEVLPAVTAAAQDKLIELLKMFTLRNERMPFCVRCVEQVCAQSRPFVRHRWVAVLGCALATRSMPFPNPISGVFPPLSMLSAGPCAAAVVVAAVRSRWLCPLV